MVLKAALFIASPLAHLYAVPCNVNNCSHTMENCYYHAGAIHQVGLVTLDEADWLERGGLLFLVPSQAAPQKAWNMQHAV